ncbi:MAG: Stp1/IreP family PP2C-type Ser/Thr phosphatase, partial [Acidimicrobiales bacterium]
LRGPPVTVLRSGVATDIGRARDSNEDRAAAGDTLFAVADGMGGARGGEVAARMAVETLQRAYDRNPTIAGLREAFVAANTAIWDQSLRTEELHGMGTTLTAAGLTVGPDGRDLMCLANVGDSRAYLMSSGQVRQITADHSLAEERVRHGEMTEAEAEVHPHRHILTRALGVGAEVAVDLWELHVKTGDRLLLCSDGLTNEVGIEQIGQVLSSVKDPRKAARALVDRANAHGGSDNVTVVVVDVLVGEDGPPVPSSVSRVLISEAGTESSPEAAPPGAAVMVEAPTVTQAVAASPTNGTTGEMFVASPTSVGVQTLPPRQYREEIPELAPPPREPRRDRRRRLGIPRRVTVRVVLFILLLLAVPAGGIAVVRWYSTDNWYVAIDHGRLAVYQGRQGGFLGFEPKLLDLTGVTTSEILSYRLPVLRHTVNEPSLQAGERYIANLHEEFIAQQNQTPLGQER